LCFIDFSLKIIDFINCSLKIIDFYVFFIENH